MPGPGAVLRDLHRLRRHVRDLQDEIERGPQRIKAHQARAERQEAQLHEAQDRIKHLKVDTRDKENTLKTKLQQIAKHKKQLNEVTGKKEYEALQAEITAEEKERQKLEDEIIDVMAKTEERQAQLPDLEKAVQQAKQESAQVVAEMEARRNGLIERLKEVQKQLQESEASLTGDARAQYERLVKARGEDALAAVQGRTCTACYTEITAQSANELMMGQFVTCKNCGRMLYLPEIAAVP